MIENIKRIYYDWKSLIKDSSKNNCSILIAGRIKDNKKILIDSLKNNFKVLIEKPIFTETKTFDRFLKYKMFIHAFGVYSYIRILEKTQNISWLVLNCFVISFMG